MHKMIFATGLGAAIALALVGAAPAPAAAAAAASTATGVYTATQADQGKAIYDGACAICHGPNLRGSFEAPPLTGRLIANWAGDSIGGLHAYVQKAMPLFAPGSMSGEDTSKLVAYILKTNGYPAGATPLPPDTAGLSAIGFAPLTPAQLVAMDAGR